MRQSVSRAARVALLAIATVTAANSAHGQTQAQVGFEPTKSPYLDLDYHQDFTALFGEFVAKHDPAGVAPQSGLLTGLLYEWRAGGPAYLTAEFSHIASQRTIVDTAKSVLTRHLGPRSDPLTALDLSAALSLPGFKSWHRLVPMVKGGVGLISDFHGADAGGFSYGTRFAFSWGAGVRFIPAGRWAFRADINNRLYSVTYPESYYHTPTGVTTPVLASTQSRTSWLNNPALTLGLAYQFSK